MNKLSALQFILMGALPMSLVSLIEKPLPLLFQQNFCFHEYGKEELFPRAKVWFSSKLEDPNSIIEVDDKEQGELFGKSCFDCSDRRIEDGTTYNSLIGLVQYPIYSFDF